MGCGGPNMTLKEKKEKEKDVATHWRSDKHMHHIERKRRLI
jgi:hypothetical protein